MHKVAVGEPEVLALTDPADTTVISERRNESVDIVRISAGVLQVIDPPKDLLVIATGRAAVAAASATRSVTIYAAGYALVSTAGAAVRTVATEYAEVSVRDGSTVVMHDHARIYAHDAGVVAVGGVRWTEEDTPALMHDCGQITVIGDFPVERGPRAGGPCYDVEEEEE